jgi:DNA-binding response OmpR family regulator
MNSSKSTVLVVGVATAPRPSSVLDVYTASSVREALSTIRLISFDLVLAGLDDPTLDVWTLLQRVSSAWPQQKWILASSQVTPEEEILARSLGALMILHAIPDGEWLAECAASLRRRGVATRVEPLPLLVAIDAEARALASAGGP